MSKTNIIKRLEVLENKVKELEQFVKKRKILTPEEIEERAKKYPEYKKGHDPLTIMEQMNF